jgi:hypothetical protein
MTLSTGGQDTSMSIATTIAERFAEALRANNVRTYRKKQTVAIRPAVADEVVETVIDGERETVNIAKSGDYVVRGAQGEQYIIDSQTRAERYGAPVGTPQPDGYREYEARGSVHAFRYDGEPFKFVAPWGEDMIVNPGDYIGTPQIGSDHFYRIEKNAFAESYVEVLSS